MSAIWAYNDANYGPPPIGGNNDDSVQPADYRRTLPNTYEASDRDFDVMWYRSQTFGGIGPLDNIQHVWEWNYPATGHHRPKKISGITKDSTGAVLGGVTVLLFNTATNTFVDTVVSNSVGAYELSDPNNVTCFVVGELAGSPDVAGATDNNLTGT